MRWSCWIGAMASNGLKQIRLMKYNFNLSMHKETLATAYSSNPEENLLSYAQENQIGSQLDNIVLPEQIRGWAHTSKMTSGQGSRQSPNNIIRRRSFSTKRNTSSSNTSSDAEENKEFLKQKLNKYLGTIEDLPRTARAQLEPPLTCNNLLAATIDLPTQDYVQGHKLKGFLRRLNLKRSQNHNVTSIDSRHLKASKKKELPASNPNSGFRLRGVKTVGLVSYPMDVGFAWEQEESRLKSKLHSYLQVHLNLEQV